MSNSKVKKRWVKILLPCKLGQLKGCRFLFSTEDVKGDPLKQTPRHIKRAVYREHSA
ncbi:unnamed protein product [Dovyalis caffra]|uniref:Uncharacterized protein n=1 Tax=Dovyalis caffra TaxID=77055 RepID=A0AAV1SJ17_9ROSI|nr:unnamed protein product [Dovyalis caffra]